MYYEFECKACGRRHILQRMIEDRDVPANCRECNSGLRRLVSMPQLALNRISDRPEMKYALGYSAEDRLKNVRAGEMRYEKRRKEDEELKKHNPLFAPEPASKLGPDANLYDCGQEMGLNQSAVDSLFAGD